MNFKSSLLFIAMWHQINSIEYVYPVCTDDNDTVFYVYQKSLTDAELWCHLLNSETPLKCLDWRYMPAGVKLLPDNNGFSFIDTGRLRIKQFAKRSTHTVDFDQPVYGVSEINWVNNQLCYFSAKQKEHFGIFWGDVLKGLITPLYQTIDTECLSPRIIGEQLFCVERHFKDRSCRIILKALKATQSNVILDCGYQQVIFLQMLSPVLGFYIEHMPYINSESELVTFICHKIEFINKSQRWLATRLFKFNILKKYLLGDDRLYESLIPFLPHAKKTILYFADIKQNQSGQYYSSINSCDLTTGKFDEVLQSNPDMIFFAPLVINNHQLVYGKIAANFGDEVCLGYYGLV